MRCNTGPSNTPVIRHSARRVAHVIYHRKNTEACKIRATGEEGAGRAGDDKFRLIRFTGNMASMHGQLQLIHDVSDMFQVRVLLLRNVYALDRWNEASSSGRVTSPKTIKIEKRREYLRPRWTRVVTRPLRELGSWTSLPSRLCCSWRCAYP